MPDDPTPTPTPVASAIADIDVSTPRNISGPLQAYARVLNLEPSAESKRDVNTEITLSAHLVVGVLSTAQGVYDFQVTLGSVEASGAAGAHAMIRFSLAPGTLTEFDIEVEHTDANAGTFELEAMVLAAPVGSGNFRQIALIPDVGADLWTYDVE